MPGKVVRETGSAGMLIETLKAMFLLPACTYCMIAFSHVYDDRVNQPCTRPKRQQYMWYLQYSIRALSMHMQCGKSDRVLHSNSERLVPQWYRA